MKISELNLSEYHPYYIPYINKAGEGNMMDVLKKSGEEMSAFMEGLPFGKLEYRYAEGKWTIKEVLQHIIDTERVFAYRALCFSRGDNTPLPGYDENTYAPNSLANRLSIKQLIGDYQSVRTCTLSLYRSFDEGMLTQCGVASGNSLSVRAIAFILVGHERHHAQVIKERYLDFK